MKILHVITGMRKAAGTSVFVAEVAHEQVELGHEVTIVHQETWRTDNYPIDGRVEFVGKKDFLRSVTDRSYDVVHIHGMWEYMLHRFARLCRQKGWPYIWSPHGSVTPWAMKFKRWKKIPVWWLWQRNDIRGASILHVTAECEAQWMRDWGFTQKCVIAPLGVRLGETARLEGKTVLFVSRIHRKKGLDLLLKAIARIPDNGYRFRIVGPDQENHIAELKILANELGVMSRIEFVGAKFDEELKNEYLNAALFVLPTYSENFGSVVIESLAVGVPVICTQGAPWQELESRQCGWWPSVDVDSLRQALLVAMSTTVDMRREMGRRGRELVREKYSWMAVASTLEDAYKELRSKCA